MNSNDHALIVNAVASLGILVDSRQWRDLVNLFTPDIRIDYTSLFGGEAEHKAAAHIVDGWAAFLPRFSGTQHMIGIPQITINGDKASVAVPVIGYHFIGNALNGESTRWVVGGHYNIELQRTGVLWLISALTLKALWQEGALPV